MGLTVVSSADSTKALIVQVLQVLGDKKGPFLSLDQNDPEEQDAQARQKADWLHIAYLCLFGPLFSFLLSKEKIFL